jgi:hypothetical protein
MLDPNPFEGWWSALASLPNKWPKNSGALFVTIIILSGLLFPLLVSLAWDGLAPLFHAPSMTYANAAGLSFFFLLLVATIAFLKE